jgi:hypothetical protein
MTHSTKPTMKKSANGMTTKNVTLVRGQTYQQHSFTGSIILLKNGSVCVKAAPQLLADSMVRTNRRLTCDESYEVLNDGWLHIHALSDATLFLQTPLSITDHWRLQFSALLHRFADVVGGDNGDQIKL